MDETQKFANRLQFLIKQCGYKMYEVAERTAIPLRTLNDYCKGRSPIPHERLEILAAFLECSISAIRDESAESHLSAPSPMLLSSLDEAISERGNITMDTARRKLLLQFLEMSGMLFVASSPGTLLEDAAGISACWNLYYEGKAEYVLSILPVYRNRLAGLAHQTSPIQKQASVLLSEVYQLACEIATDQEQGEAAQQASQLALLYAQDAGEPNMHVAALMRLANLYFHQSQPARALQTYQLAIPLLKLSTPLLRGRIYAGMAEVHAMLKQKRQALNCIGLAHEHYPAQPEMDPAYRYTHITRYSLYVFGEGQTRLYLNQPKEADQKFTYVQENIITDQTDPLTRVDLLYYQATAAMQMNDLSTSHDRILEAATLAKSIRSNLYFNKIAGTYQQMKQKWGQEQKIMQLESLFQQ